MLMLVFSAQENFFVLKIIGKYKKIYTLFDKYRWSHSKKIFKKFGIRRKR